MSTKKDIDKLNKYLKKMYNINLDKSNKAMLKQGNLPIAVVAVPEKDLLLVSSPLINLPEENLLPLFRKLLTLNLTDTQDAAFAINESVGTIDLQVKRPLVNLDYEELQRAINTVASVSGKYINILAKDFDTKGVVLHSPRAGTWSRYLNAMNPFTLSRPARTNSKAVHKVRTIFSVLGIASAIAAGIYTYTRTSSWALAIFVFLWTQFIMARAIPDLITDPNKIKRFIFFALHPAVGVALLLGIYELWQIWWLAALIGYLGGLFLGRFIASIILPRISLEETQDDEQRRSAWKKAQSGVV
ncbi:MAG: CesT family type III secretion system chaperone [Bacteroidales bacterium]|nr:CesT family type III secretion system chaperone [Bacteroidales bacterium]